MINNRLQTNNVSIVMENSKDHNELHMYTYQN